MNPIFLFIPAAFLLIVAIVRRRGGALSGIQNITTSLPQNGAWKYRNTGEITDITLHHSASPASWPAGRIADIHIKERKWPGIAYHFLVYESGKVYQTNRVDSWTYHNGYNNKKAIGVCMVGNYETSSPTKKQMESFIALCEGLKKEYPSITRLVGHKEYRGASTACPGGNNPLPYYRQKLRLRPFSEVETVSILAGYYKYNSNEADN